jgi:hypothetical protein
MQFALSAYKIEVGHPVNIVKDEKLGIPHEKLCMIEAL